MIFHVARDGEVIGEFDEEDFREKLGRKEILWTDHFLAEASQEWKPVHDYNPGRNYPRKRRQYEEPTSRRRYRAR